MFYGGNQVYPQPRYEDSSRSGSSIKISNNQCILFGSLFSAALEKQMAQSVTVSSVIFASAVLISGPRNSQSAVTFSNGQCLLPWIKPKNCWMLKFLFPVPANRIYYDSAVPVMISVAHL